MDIMHLHSNWASSKLLNDCASIADYGVGLRVGTTKIGTSMDGTSIVGTSMVRPHCIVKLMEPLNVTISQSSGVSMGGAKMDETSIVVSDP